MNLRINISVAFLIDYILFKPVSKVLALMAMCFRVTQTAVLALNLLHHYAAFLSLHGNRYHPTIEKDENLLRTDCR